MKLSILGSTGSIGTQALDVAEHNGYSVCALAAGRNEKLAEQQARKFRPRMVAMYLTRELTDMSLTAIGEFYGRDHTTVHHAYKTISEDSAKDTELRSLIANIRKQLNA